MPWRSAGGCSAGGNRPAGRCPWQAPGHAAGGQRAGQHGRRIGWEQITLCHDPVIGSLSAATHDGQAATAPGHRATEGLSMSTRGIR